MAKNTKTGDTLANLQKIGDTTNTTNTTKITSTTEEKGNLEKHH